MIVDEKLQQLKKDWIEYLMYSIYEKFFKKSENGIWWITGEKWLNENEGWVLIELRTNFIF